MEEFCRPSQRQRCAEGCQKYDPVDREHNTTTRVLLKKLFDSPHVVHVYIYIYIYTHNYARAYVLRRHAINDFIGYPQNLHLETLDPDLLVVEPSHIPTQTSVQHVRPVLLNQCKPHESKKTALLENTAKGLTLVLTARSRLQLSCISSAWMPSFVHAHPLPQAYQATVNRTRSLESY